MFRGYLNDEARYSCCFAVGRYLTGDLACRDLDGFSSSSVGPMM
jgi:acetyl-CoA synthetase